MVQVCSDFSGGSMKVHKIGFGVLNVPLPPVKEVFYLQPTKSEKPPKMKASERYLNVPILVKC